MNEANKVIQDLYKKKGIKKLTEAERNYGPQDPTIRKLYNMTRGPSRYFSIPQKQYDKLFGSPRPNN